MTKVSSPSGLPAYESRPQIRDTSRRFRFGGFRLKQIGYASLIIALLITVLIGILLYSHSNSKTLLLQEYTFCTQTNSSATCNTIVDNQMTFNKPTTQPCNCKLYFELDQDEAFDQVNIYYGLKNFHQNYRFLTFSRDPAHLTGRVENKPPKECHPHSSSDNKTIFPCGSLANVLFDDEFNLSYEDTTSIQMDRFSIALERSRKYQYINPSNLNVLKEFVKPPRWHRDLENLDDSNDLNNGIENGGFIVWMTISTFEDFYKLYSIIRPVGGIMRKGRYSLNIIYRFGVHEANEGNKYVLIESVTSQGVRNVRLLIVLMVVGIIYLAMFIIIICLFLRRWGALVQDLVREL